MNVRAKYQEHCESMGLKYESIDKVNPYDDTTLFCPAGMQKYKEAFKTNDFIATLANTQSCIRVNDIEEIGDSSHLVYFNMLGLFSFRDWGVATAIRFWIDFLKKIGLTPDYVTVHPDKINDKQWTAIYENLRIKIVSDEDCTWSDGEIGGYCTEFFCYNSENEPIEIGNIVNPLGTCIDAGFGLERLEIFVNNKTIDEVSTLKESILKIIDSGYKPSANKQGYVLRKLLRKLWQTGGTIDHHFFVKESKRQERNKSKYLKLRDKHADKSLEWWWYTHGINPEFY